MLELHNSVIFGIFTQLCNCHHRHRGFVCLFDLGFLKIFGHGTCGIFSTQPEIEFCALHWKGRIFTADHQGSLSICTLIHNNPMRQGSYYYCHFTEKETKAQRDKWSVNISTNVWLTLDHAPWQASCRAQASAPCSLHHTDRAEPEAASSSPGHTAHLYTLSPVPWMRLTNIHRLWEAVRKTRKFLLSGGSRSKIPQWGGKGRQKFTLIPPGRRLSMPRTAPDMCQIILKTCISFPGEGTSSINKK